MNIHLLKSPELKEETYRNVLYLLQQFRGPINFLECEEDILQYDRDDNDRIWTTQKDFEKVELVRFNNSLNESLLKNDSFRVKFPHREIVKTWDQLFSKSDSYRTTKKISQDDIVVLLTDFGNKPNWFGGVSPSMKNFFIQTSNWEHFFGTNIDIRFPIAYEVIIWVMRYYMFSSNQEIMENIHKDPVGCIMDFCEDKKQIILKMRTADACESCMNRFIERDVPILYTQQFFAILDGIRNSMTFRGRAKLFHKPSRLEINGYTKKIFFIDLGGLELRLNPKEKALYLLFLNHPEGIYLNHLHDFKDELINLYSRFCNQPNRESLHAAIELLVNPLENDTNITLSRINKKIREAVGDNLFGFYDIRGERADKKTIKLDRELVNNLSD
jgi:hypothetical protein